MSEQAMAAGSTGTSTSVSTGGDAGTSAAASGQGGNSPSVNANGATGTSADWTVSLSEELKGYVQNKGFKDPGTVVDSYRNLEKLIGAPKERVLKLPEKADDPAWGDIYNRLGRPQKPEEYGIKGDEQFTKWAQDTFHKLGLTRTQAEKLVAGWEEHNKGISNAALADSTAKAINEDKALKAEWGQAYDKHTSIAKQAVKEFGMDADTIDRLESALGYAGVMKLMYNIGAKIGEAPFVSGQGGQGFGGVMAPAAAKQRIADLRQDSDFVRRYTNGDTEARQEMMRLHQMAYSD